MTQGREMDGPRHNLYVRNAESEQCRYHIPSTIRIGVERWIEDDSVVLHRVD